MFLVAANTRQAIVGQKEWITTGSSGIQVQFLFSDDWEGLSKFAVFRNAEIEESKIPIALTESNLTELPAENCAAEYVDEKVYVGVYGSDGLGHIIIPTIWVSLGVLKEGAAYEGMDPPQPTPDMWAQILAIAQNAGAENAEAAEKAAGEAKTAVTHYPKIVDGYWYVWNAETETWVNTEIRAEGRDGYSPEVTITEIEGGHRVTITDEDHPQGQTFDVMDGQGGSTGDYDELTNRPRINGHTLTGNQSASDLGLGTYSKPADGIPKTDLAQDVQQSLRKADTALQTAPVQSVAGKTGAVNLGAGDVGFNSSEEYNEGTVGAELSELNRQLSDVEENQIPELKNAIDALNGGSINLLNPADFEEGKYLVVGGGLSDNADLTTSGFFPVSGNTTYYLYKSSTYIIRICFYTNNSETEYISNSLTDISSGTFTFTTPLTAAYARISTNKNMILDMGIYASDIRYYIPYQLRLNVDMSIENQIDNTLADAKKAAPADIVGQIKSHVIFPENCIKFGDVGMIVDERLDTENGAIVTNSTNQTRTDFIPVNVGDFVQTCAIRDICLYDDQFEYIGFINLWSANVTPAPPESWSGNYNSNITEITAVNGIDPAYIRCWGRYDSYPPAVTMLSEAPYKVVNLGDSIFGNNEKPWDLGTYIQNITGMKDANCGYGGTTARVIPSGNMAPLGLPSIVDCIVSEDFSPLQTPAYWANLQEYRYSVPTLLFGMVDFTKINIITIAYGTNDWNSSTPLDNAENRLDTSTYKGGLRYAVENLQTKYPAITLVMLSPIYRYWSNASDYSTVDQDSDTRTNNLGFKLTDYVTAMQEVAEEYHLPYYDNYAGIGLNRYTAPTWLRDGTHLNRGIGVDKFGHIVAKEVNQIY